MKESIVGDPIFWPGLVYSPLNINGLLFALGTVTDEVGLLFEEFSGDGSLAICRRKTEDGWKRIRVAFSVRSSEYNPAEDRPDLLICWDNDADLGGDKLSILELSRIKGLMGTNNTLPGKPIGDLDGIFPEDPSNDLLHRGETIAGFEETIRQLDDRIKKLKNG
ncbi:MAG: hypothetical protein JSU85_05930 [Candidatus Zixiibacteriota bacterium]|nr:MAG: hypothetical protein JSU85_05930 [candidate division Zixibacteria bacterium]